jgi:hypothetical protein
MSKQKIMNKWLATFAPDIPEEIMSGHVIGNYCHLWHIFTWGKVSCLEADSARQAFDQLEFERAIMFTGGYTFDNETNINDLGYVTKSSASASELEDIDDVYIIGEDFSWTYVHTHEPECGPYFVNLD